VQIVKSKYFTKYDPYHIGDIHYDENYANVCRESIISEFASTAMLIVEIMDNLDGFVRSDWESFSHTGWLYTFKETHNQILVTLDPNRDLIISVDKTSKPPMRAFFHKEEMYEYPVKVDDRVKIAAFLHAHLD
jgi:hypothetical protein